MLLADFGADVIKVENPDGGDDTRQWGPPWLDDQSAYYLSVNRNKRSIAVDIKQPRGLEIVRRLASKADVLVENFRAGTMEKYGLGYDILSQDNQGLVFCSITGYGQTGPYSALAGYDFIIQAEGGLMSITGPVDGPPCKVGVAIVDITAGMFASHAILAALHYREKTGRGQYIDVSLLDSQIGWLANISQNYLVSGNTPKRFGNAHPNIVPYEVFQTLDGYLALGIGNDRQYKRFCEIADRNDLWQDPRFKTNPDRVQNREILIPILQEVFTLRPTAKWIAQLNAASVPAGPINDIPTALKHPQVLARDMIQKVQKPGSRPVKLVGPVAKLSETPARIYCHPPSLGENTMEILTHELNYSSQQINELRISNII